MHEVSRGLGERNALDNTFVWLQLLTGCEALTWAVDAPAGVANIAPVVPEHWVPIWVSNRAPLAAPGDALIEVANCALLATWRAQCSVANSWFVGRCPDPFP